MSTRRKAEYVRRNAFLHEDKILKILIANTYTTFQKKRGAKHGAQLWQKHHFDAKGFMGKIRQKGKKKKRRL